VRSEHSQSSAEARGKHCMQATTKRRRMAMVVRM
jgi:hypothetical protein